MRYRNIVLRFVGDRLQEFAFSIGPAFFEFHFGTSFHNKAVHHLNVKAVQAPFSSVSTSESAAMNGAALLFCMASQQIYLGGHASDALLG